MKITRVCFEFASGESVIFWPLIHNHKPVYNVSAFIPRDPENPHVNPFIESWDGISRCKPNMANARHFLKIARVKFSESTTGEIK